VGCHYTTYISLHNEVFLIVYILKDMYMHKALGPNM
jgi:hypothetical protein